MNKIAFVFAGQGAQYTGMGKDFFDNFESSRNIFKLADEALGFGLSEICFSGSEEELFYDGNYSTSYPNSYLSYTRSGKRKIRFS
jgi:[Acyl-carrier-protein] S-malonyltransferase (EC 2.3.1.39)